MSINSISRIVCHILSRFIDRAVRLCEKLQVVIRSSLLERILDSKKKIVKQNCESHDWSLKLWRVSGGVVGWCITDAT